MFLSRSVFLYFHARTTHTRAPCARTNTTPTPLLHQGLENLVKGPCVIVCNHQSFLDPSLCAIALASLNFKCPFKHDLMMYPGVGSCLWFAGHMPVNRKDKDSGKRVLEKCAYWLARGCPALFYAEGTRWGGAGMGEFKPGAFITAQKAQVPILCLTISGARAMLPPGFPCMQQGELSLTVHPALPPPPLCSKGEDEAKALANREAVAASMKAARDVMVTALKPIDWVDARDAKKKEARD